MITITDSSVLLAAATEVLSREGLEFQALEDDLSPDEMVERSAESEVLLVGLRPFPASAIERLNKARLIVRCGIGVDIVDIEAAGRRGIYVANVPDYCVDEVADHTMALLGTTVRHVPQFSSYWKGGSWAVTEFPPQRRLSETTLGIIGLGRIGTAVAKRAAAHGMSLLAYDPGQAPERFEQVGARQASLDELLGASDVITLHCPLDSENRHLINDEAISAMRKGAVVINTSRGGLIDLDALERGMERGNVAAAGLDVLDGEPDPPLDHPLLKRDRVLVTPHVAWYSQDARRELGEKSAQLAIQFLRGEMPASVVNLSKVDPKGSAIA